MNIKRRLQQLIEELDSIGLHVQLKQWPDGLEVIANSEADRLLAQSELRKKGVMVAPPIPVSR